VNGSPADRLFTHEEIARGRRYNRPRYLALLLDLVLGTAVVAAFAVVRPSLALPWWLEAPALAALVLAASALARLPVAWWSGYVHEHRWELSTQSPRGWLVDRAKAYAVGAVLTGGTMLALVGLARASPGGWVWLAATGGALLVLLLGFVAPVVLEPIFNRFEPLADERLQSALRELSERAGAPVREVLVADASRRTRRANAYVSGFGRTRRLVLFDTFLEAAGPGELEIVTAHELGHRRTRDPLKLTLLGMGAAAVGAIVLWLVLGEEAADPRNVPLALLVLGLLQLVALPGAAAISRRWERAADRFALELTRDPVAFESLFRRFAAMNVADLDPPRAVRLLLGTHPTVPERIATVRE
jgi:STE24 endopeptidase